MPKPPNPPSAAAARAILPGRRTPKWSELNAKVGGQLVQVRSPIDACRAAPGSAECAALFRGLKNPWYIGDNVALTQTSGWVDAWTSTPSAYAVAARNTADVAAAVDFARTHRLRLVVKGGGHSYQGTSNAPDSLPGVDAQDGSHRAARRLRRARAAAMRAQPRGVGRRRRGVAAGL